MVAALDAPASRAHLPAAWLREAACIHRHESTEWHRVTDWRGYPSRDHGGFQIDTGTWTAHAPDGYPGDPAAASPRQQRFVAYLIWHGDGGSWREWPQTSRLCGLR